MASHKFTDKQRVNFIEAGMAKLRAMRECNGLPSKLVLHAEYATYTWATHGQTRYRSLLDGAMRKAGIKP
jgi:hypothetical protein